MSRQRNVPREGNRAERNFNEEITLAADRALDARDEILDENVNLESTSLIDIPSHTDTQPSTVVENYSVAANFTAEELLRFNKFVKLILENYAKDGVPQSIASFTDHFEEINSLISRKFPRREDSIWAYYNPLKRKYMDGPTCGIVALSMASQVLNEVDAPDMLTAAINKQYTRIGEMFDAEKLAKFASNYLKCEARVITNLNSLKFDILSHICDGWPVLIPYDWDGADPGMSAGEHAHWAVLNGVGFRLGLTIQSNRGLRLISTSVEQRIKERLLYDCRQSSEDIFVFARESLSKEISIWHFDSLLESNSNLMICKENLWIPYAVHLPKLRDKAVLLKKRN